MRRRAFLVLSGATVASWFALGTSPVAANRFGPPYMARVVVDQTLIYAQPDLTTQPSGPAQHGTILIVTGQTTDSAGHEWTQTTLGYVSSNDIVEYTDPWVADVTVANAPVYAKPNARDAIRL